MATHAVLLLPLPKFPTSPKQLSTRYRPTVESALLQCKATATATPSRLDIAVVIEPALENRTSVFSPVQRLFADLYTLVCSIAAQKQIGLDVPQGVDVRAFLVTLSNEDETLNGPIVSASSFIAARQGSYTTWFAPDSFQASDQGQRFQHLWKRHTGGPLTTEALPQGSLNDTSSNIHLNSGSSAIHTRVAVGGTFDHLHIGHKLLLTATVLVAQPDSNQDREITVGITGDELLVNKKHASVLESWEIRQQRTADFIESIMVFHTDTKSIQSSETLDEPGPNGHVVKSTYKDEKSGRSVTIKYTRISDPFGPTITDESISALIISAETRAGGKAVNDRREKLGWKSLEVFEVDVLDADAGDAEVTGEKADKRSFEGKISSTEIRRQLVATAQATSS